MTVLEVTQVYAELAALRRGHGLNAPGVAQKVGPALRQMCALGPELAGAEARSALIEQLSAMIKDLPSHLAIAVQAAFGLPPASQSRFLRERMEWLGARIERDPRTAVRRVDDGLNLLAERMVAALSEEPGGSDFAPAGWFVNRLRSTLLLHLNPVQLLENRRITATHEGLERITVSWSVPPSESPVQRAEVQVEVMFGGELIRDQTTAGPVYWSGWIRLPHSLRRGEQHEYQVLVTFVAREQMRSYYAFSPHRRCDEFELRAKFGPGAIPRRLWQLQGIPYRLVDERKVLGELLTPDAVGEVVSRFRDLRLGMSYGIQWDDGPAGKSAVEELAVEESAVEESAVEESAVER